MFTGAYLERLRSSRKVENSGGSQVDEDTSTRVRATKGLTRAAVMDWGNYYRDCVGSLSALKSEANLPVSSETSVVDTAEDVRSMELRSSTLDFQRALLQEQEKVKDELREKIERLDGSPCLSKPDEDDWKRLSIATKDTMDTVRASSIKTKDLQIPGSFG